PPPAVGERLELSLADASGGDPSARLDPGFAEPRALRRGGRLSAQPNVQLARLGIQLLHRLSRADRSHKISFARANNLRSATSPSSRSMAYSRRPASPFSRTIRTAGSAVSKTRRLRPLEVSSASLPLTGRDGS